MCRGAALGAALFFGASASSIARAAPPKAEGRGWSDPRALALAKDAVEAKKKRDFLLCVQADQASLALESHPYVQLHLSSCLAALGRLKRALAAAGDALAGGIHTQDEDLTRAATKAVEDLDARLPHLALAFPGRTEGLRVTINGAPVTIPKGSTRQRLATDPGAYAIEAIREDKGEKYVFHEQVTLAEHEEKEVGILPQKDNLREDVAACLRAAQSYREQLKCIEEPRTTPNVSIGLDVSGYADSTAVRVITPAIHASVVSPTGGWNVSGSYLLDIVSAASPDLVSTASRPFVEQRHAGSLGGGYKLSLLDVGVNGNVSSEPDYLSRTVGGSLGLELAEKLIVPRLAYAYSWDTIGYRNTPFDQFHARLVTHTAEAGVTFVLSPSTLLVTGVWTSFEQGENAKLYRFVPMFSADVAARVTPGRSLAEIDEARLSIGAREVVPNRRDRIAFGARLNHRLASGTLRLDQRLYTDDWGIKATTTDARYLHDLGDRLRVWPHLRVHAQTGATFYELAYTARVDPAGPIEIPRYRTTDREASPFVAVTGGGGARIALTRSDASPAFAIVLSGDVMYDYYFASLFLRSRTAVWGTLGFEAEL